MHLPFKRCCKTNATNASTNATNANPKAPSKQTASAQQDLRKPPKRNSSSRTSSRSERRERKREKASSILSQMHPEDMLIALEHQASADQQAAQNFFELIQTMPTHANANKKLVDLYDCHSEDECRVAVSTPRAA
ncbi:expressed unknown protein [Seminavis robusta]|uniref:Uncharacterized protein n=1 Tax=Seminavis robusta TaxID=568900 RepID=A0A9N8EWT4_9STRA|nr:expressed unknown protein [Seminavis robusta]|eukprot:Sro1932_g306180.1 n/a (135) ;mRNA; f:13814-14218